MIETLDDPEVQINRDIWNALADYLTGTRKQFDRFGSSCEEASNAFARSGLWQSRVTILQWLVNFQSKLPERHVKWISWELFCEGQERANG